MFAANLQREAAPGILLRVFSTEQDAVVSHVDVFMVYR